MSFEVITDNVVKQKEENDELRDKIGKKRMNKTASDMVKPVAKKAPTVTYKAPKQKQITATDVKRQIALEQELSKRYEDEMLYKEWRDKLNGLVKDKMNISENDTKINQFLKSKDLQKCIQKRFGHLGDKVDESDYMSLGINFFITFFDDIVDKYKEKINKNKDENINSNPVNIE